MGKRVVSQVELPIAVQHSPADGAGEGGSNTNSTPGCGGETELGIGQRVAVTGNRGVTAADRRVIRRVLRELLADPQIDTIYFGGAVGADTEALQAALELRRGARPRLVVVVPDSLDAQPVRTRHVSRRADEVIELRRPIVRADRWGAYHARNRWMVDHASLVVAFWDGHPRSGTAATVGYARRRGVAVRVVEVEGRDRLAPSRRSC